MLTTVTLKELNPKISMNVFHQVVCFIYLSTAEKPKNNSGLIVFAGVCFFELFSPALNMTASKWVTMVCGELTVLYSKKND